MHLADTLSKATYIAFKLQFYISYLLLLSLGIEPMILALLAHALPFELQESCSKNMYYNELTEPVTHLYLSHF